MIAKNDAELSPIRSFRDPAGFVARCGDRIVRAVQPDATEDLEIFLQSPTARAAMDAGKLIRSVRIPASDFPELETAYLVEHERIPFPSYPYEWSPEMLFSAGELTLELMRSALRAGFGLKDATPYNVLFRGGEAVFIDVLSFERRDPAESAWMAYAQFVRTFLLPLLAARHFRMPLDRSLAGHRDGLEPEDVYCLAGPLQRWLPPFLSLVTLPKLLGGRAVGPSYAARTGGSAEKAKFVLDGLLKSCERQLRAMQPREADSKWSGYLDHKSLYSPEQLAQKEAFVAEALALTRPKNVLDVGANEGHFSCVAARSGASVVAIDTDPAVVGSIWKRVSAGKLDVLPLVVDLTRPSPAIGWRNQECASFLDRARGRFDLVMMLAVMHHVLVTERIPIEELFDLLEEIGREYVLIEFVAPEDPMFQRIVRGRERLYSHMTKAWFEAAAGERFELMRSVRIDGLHRWLYLFRPRRARS